MAKSLMLATTLLCFGAVSVSAQSTSSPPAGASNSTISASTHCRDSNGQPRTQNRLQPVQCGFCFFELAFEFTVRTCRGRRDGRQRSGQHDRQRVERQLHVERHVGRRDGESPELLRTAEYCERPVEKAGCLLVQDRSESTTAMFFTSLAAKAEIGTSAGARRWSSETPATKEFASWVFSPKTSNRWTTCFCM